MSKKQKADKTINYGERYSEYVKESEKKDVRAENPKDTLKRLAKYLLPELAPFIVVLIFAIISAAISVFTIDISGDLVDILDNVIKLRLAGNVVSLKTFWDNESIKLLLNEETIKAFWENPIILFLDNPVTRPLIPLLENPVKRLIIYNGFGIIAAFVESYLMAGISQRMVCKMREQVNRKLSRLPLSYYDNNATGEVISKIMNDVGNISTTIQDNVIKLTTSLITFIIVLVMMIMRSPIMALIAIALLPVSAIVAFVIAPYSKKQFKIQWKKMGQLSGHIEEMYTGHKIVKIFGHEEKAIEEFDAINEDLYNSTRKASFISSLISPILSFIGQVRYVLICVIGVALAVKSQFSFGSIIKFTMFASKLNTPIDTVSNIFNNIQSSLVSAERVFKLLDEPEEEPDSEDAIKKSVNDISGEVKIESLDFSYIEGTKVLNNINAVAQPGQMIAIVGPTGGGKTTIVNLLMRFYEPDSGAIYVDGTNTKYLTRDNVRDIFGMVLQDTWIFEGTVKENIAYGKLNATDEEILKAASSAQLDSIVNTMPNGYDTMLEENGENISQGQRQLITIARAMLSDPKILILDEATSSVDTTIELAIQKATKKLMEGRTSFVIAHRLSTILDADKILVINHGELVEQGTHEELMSKNGFYNELYNSQFYGMNA